MANHGAQLIDTSGATAYGWGTFGWGHGDWGGGGNANPIVAWPNAHDPGDIPGQVLREEAYEDVLSDETGRVVQTYLRTTGKRINLVFSKLTAAQVETLRGFWRARHFLYYPDLGVPTSVYTVRWNDSGFNPERVNRSAYYSLEVPLLEITTA